MLFPTQRSSAQDGEMRYFYRSSTTRQLDLAFGDIFGAILDLESELCTEMQDQVLTHSTLLYSLSGLAAQLDCMIALTRAAENHRMTRPNIVCGGQTSTIVRGRHILQECCVDQFIPNDSHIESGSLTLITGPNWSGKRSVLIDHINYLTGRGNS